MAGSVIEDIRHGAEVYASGGEKVGTVYAIVLAPGENEVTHIAIDAGPHFPEPGFGDPKVLVVAIGHVTSATEARIDLDLARDVVATLPPFEHSHWFSVPKSERPREDEKETVGGWLWNAGIAITRSLASLGSGIAVPAEHFASAAFERSILNDAPVWRVDPETYIGDVERVLVDEATDEIVSLVVKRGEVFQHEVVLPMANVTEIAAGVIHANLTDAELKSLAKFEE